MLRRVRRVHIVPDGFVSSFCRLQDGELLVHYSAPAPDGKGYMVNLVRSDDGARTWSEPRTIIHPRDGVYAGCHLGTAQLADGAIILPFLLTNPLIGEHSDSAHILMSVDNGRTWEDPIRLAPDGVAPSELTWAYTYGRIRELGDGTVIVPACGQFPGDRLWRTVHFRSYDGGRTWPETVTVAVGMDNEHDVIELSDNLMLAVFRDWRSPRYGHGVSPLWESSSEDLGRTWSEPTITFQALYGHSPALFLTHRGTLICSYRYVGDLDIGICGVGFSIWDEEKNEWGKNHHVVDTPGIGEYRLGCGYPSWDYVDEERFMCVYHTNPTYVASPSHPCPEGGFYTDIEGTIYIEES